MARLELGGNYILRGIANPVEGNDAVNLDTLRTQIETSRWYYPMDS